MKKTRSSARGLIAAKAITILFSTTLLFRPAAAEVVHVDDDASPGGNGSAARPYRTIQEGIDGLPKNGGRVLIEPGVYVGPILVDRDAVDLRGNTDPIYDENGFLHGFSEEVLVTLDRPLFSGPGLQPEDAVELRGSNNKVHNLVVDIPPGYVTGENSAVSARAEDDEFYDGIEIKNIIVRGATIDTGVWTSKANAEISHITALDGGFVGISPVANGSVEIYKVNLANWALAAVCFLAVWEPPADDPGPSAILGSISESKLSNSLIGLLMIGQGGFTNPAADSSVEVHAEAVTFERNEYAIHIQPSAYLKNIEPRFLFLRAQNNSYIANTNDASVYFQSFLLSGGPFVIDSTVLVDDGDGIFQAIGRVNLGPPQNGNIFDVR